MESTKNEKKTEFNPVIGEKPSRGEKKTKKALEGFGFEKFNEISKIRFQKTKNVIFVISQPEIFRSFKHGSFLVFGEARMESGPITNDSRED